VVVAVEVAQEREPVAGLALVWVQAQGLVKDWVLVLVPAPDRVPDRVRVPALERVPGLVLVTERAPAVTALVTAPAMTATDPRMARATVPEPARPSNPGLLNERFC